MPKAPRVNKSASEIAQSIEKSYRASKARLEKALAELTPGSVAFVRCCEALEDCERRYREERAKRGIDPTNLGLSTKPTGWTFVAHVSVDGSVSTREVSPDRIEEVLANRRAQHRERLRKLDTPERRAAVAELESEFPSDAPQHSAKESDHEE